MFKFIVLCAALAIANAGYLAPAAPAISYSTYAAAPAVRYASAAPAVSYTASYAAPALSYAAPAVSYAAPAVSYAAPVATTAVVGQQSNILRSFGNLGTVSTYSKYLNTPFSSVTKSDVRVSNPGYRLAAAAPVATYAAAAPAVTTYHGNAFGYAAAPALGYAAAAPAISYAHAAPAISYAHAAPAISYAHAAPAVSYAAAAPVAYGRVGYAGLGYAAATPAISHVTYTGSYGSYAW